MDTGTGGVTPSTSCSSKSRTKASCSSAPAAAFVADTPGLGSRRKHAKERRSVARQRRRPSGLRLQGNCLFMLWVE